MTEPRRGRWTGVRLVTGASALLCVAVADGLLVVGMTDTYVPVAVLLAVVAVGLTARALAGAPGFLTPALALAAAPVALTLVDHPGIRWSVAATGPLLLAAGELMAFSHDAWSVAPPGRRATVARVFEIGVLTAIGAAVSVGAVAMQKQHPRSSIALLAVGALAVVGMVWVGIDIARPSPRPVPAPR